MDGLKVYMMMTGTPLVGQEIKAKGGKRVVKGLARLELHPSNARFVFSPIQFFEPTAEFELYESSLLGEQPMPAMIAEGFKGYLMKLEADEQRLQQEIEAAKDAAKEA